MYLVFGFESADERPKEHPHKVGLVGSLSRPIGNLTGVTVFLTVLGPKRVELLHELLARAEEVIE